MILTISDLISELIARDVPLLDSQPVTHAPTIGQMYEGLTADILQKSLPVGDENLRVASGFAVGGDGSESRQLDCMVILGEAQEIPYTSLVKVPVDNIIAVVEVKKTLDKEDIFDGYNNLRSVSELEFHSKTFQPGALFQDALRLIIGRRQPHDASRLSPELQQMFHHLLIQYVQPALILLGYHGHTTMRGFRNAIADHVKSLVGVRGHGPRHLPSLIANQRFSVVKANGLPWGGRENEDGFFPLLGSLLRAPSYALLEVVWTRLNARGILSASAFGDDMELDSMIRLVDMRPNPAQNGWEYLFHTGLSERQLSELANEPQKMWEPLELSHEQAALLMIAATSESIDASEFSEAFASAVFLPLVEMGLMAPVAGENSMYEVATSDCVTVMVEERIFAGESRRMTRWARQQAELRRPK